jgi:hypothetical protein
LSTLFAKFFAFIFTFRIIRAAKGENTALGGGFYGREDEICPARADRAHAQCMRDCRREVTFRIYYIMYAAPAAAAGHLPYLKFL